MAFININNSRVAGIGTCAPTNVFNNIADTKDIPADEVRKVVGMAGVSERRVGGETICSSDLCSAAGKKILEDLGWESDSVDAAIMVTQTPDYFLPSTVCRLHKSLGLSEKCATFDVNMGCSGYPYGIWLGSMMLGKGDIRRVLLFHGDTAARYSMKGDRSVSLLFGDAGSATALELDDSEKSGEWFFLFHTDSTGLEDMIIEGGGFRERFPVDPSKYYVRMNGANVFNFTIKRVPPLVTDTLRHAGISMNEVDYYIFHQSNQFIMKHLVNKIKIPLQKAPIILGEFGNTGGCSIPLAITQGKLERPEDRALKLMLLGYGVGLSWASAMIELDPDAILRHVELECGEK